MVVGSINPSGQTGGMLVDDTRNPRSPLPHSLPPGGVGADWIERERNMAPDVRPPEWGGPRPYPPAWTVANAA
jgi:hypothetical protein